MTPRGRSGRRSASCLRLRAETLAARGLARWVHPKELTGERLAEAMEWALRCDRKAHARRVRETIPSFDGAARLTNYLSRWLGAAQQEPEPHGVYSAR